MRLALLLPFVLAVTTGAVVAGVTPCDKPKLFAALKDASEVDAPPKLDQAPGAWIARLRLIDSPLATDAFKYDAVFDSSTSRAWLVQFGGFAGGVRWFGPVQVAPEVLLACPEVKSAILLSERAVAKAREKAASGSGQ